MTSWENWTFRNTAVKTSNIAMNNSSLSSLCKPVVLKIKLKHDRSFPWHHALPRPFVSVTSYVVLTFRVRDIMRCPDLSCPWHHALSRGSQQPCLSFPPRMTFLSLSRLGRGPTLFTNSCVLLENCALLGYYAANSGNFLPTFLDYFLAQSSRFKNPKGKNHYSLRNNPEVRVSHLLRDGSMKSRTVLLGRLNSEDGRRLNSYKSHTQMSELYRNV